MNPKRFTKSVPFLLMKSERKIMNLELRVMNGVRVGGEDCSSRGYGCVLLSLSKDGLWVMNGDWTKKRCAFFEGL
jgi:hypothetical protein